MKVSREQAAQNRERVLDVAAEQFRQKGFDGIGVADLMKSAGLTHGGFYGQFASKEDLMAQACTRAFAHLADGWQRALAPGRDKATALRKLIQSYLSATHRDHPEGGCVVAALGPESARQGPALRAAVTQGIQAQLAMLAQLMPQPTAAGQRQQAIQTYAGMVGALVLARAVDDEALSLEILHTVAAALEPKH
jgi:TetR/AcrR family transcriptional repressor of nem operon